MKRKPLMFLTAIALTGLSCSVSYAGSISTNPLTERSDEIKSVSIKKQGTDLYKVLVTTNLETISIDVKNYADASALASDMSKNTKLICNMPSRIRTGPESKCKVVEMRFND